MKKIFNLLTVSHDAGGAEVLSSYIKYKTKEYDRIFCITEGPAERIFSQKKFKKNIVNVNIGKKLILDKKIDLLMTSTSWNKNIEIDFIKLAKRNAIKTISILDHWMHYKERFGHPHKDWELNLPDEMWTVDKLAKAFAAKEFNGLAKIKVKPNFYFRDLKKEYGKIGFKKKTNCFNILFLNDLSSESRFPKRDNMERVNKLIKFMKKLSYDRPLCVTIRPHLAEDILKYLHIVEYNLNNRNLRVVLSNPLENPLLKDIEMANLVIGVKSMTLVIARLFKKKVVCYSDEFPIWLAKHDVKYIANNLDELKEVM